MDFELSADQEALVAGVRDFVAGRFDVETIRAIDAEGSGFDAARWRELAELGVFSLRLAEDRGGVGLGTADAAIVFGELGAGCVPGPLVWTHCAAELVDGAGSGDVVVTGLDRTGPLGGPEFVAHLASADCVVVVDDDGLTAVPATSVDAEAAETSLDPLTPVHHLLTLGAGDRIGDADAARAFVRTATVLTAAQLLGLSEASLRLAVDFARDRVQFDRPIGSFQAVKHMCADMLVRTEVARAAVYAAAVTIDEPDVGDVDLLVAAAKICAGEAADRNARAAVQVFGGMGYTWEVPVHYYLKRAWVLDRLFGEPPAHSDAVAAMLQAR